MNVRHFRLCKHFRVPLLSPSNKQSNVASNKEKEGKWDSNLLKKKKKRLDKWWQTTEKEVIILSLCWALDWIFFQRTKKQKNVFFSRFVFVTVFSMVVFRLPSYISFCKQRYICMYIYVYPNEWSEALTAYGTSYLSTGVMLKNLQHS